MDISVTIDIKPEWVETAQKFAAEQHQTDRQQQIFLHTLAIYGLHEYLAWGEIESSLTDSYSWHPQTRVLTAWADLYLPNYGRILCAANQKEALIPLPEILPLNCIGCVVVDIAEDLQKLELQGFISTRSFDLEKSQFNRADITAIASLFDELYLLTEEQLLVEQEMLQLSAMDDDLEAYFSPLLDLENIIDIVGRLNRLFYEPKTDLENVFIIDEIDEELPKKEATLMQPEVLFADLSTIDEMDEETPTIVFMSSQVQRQSLLDFPLLEKVAEDADQYTADTPQEKIAEATQALTENLLAKLQQLRDELT
ncbi:MAG: DUF1822 family protein [Limnothrix sp. RL_2_0]|nr:DUF1822 family protein [Limnothrix sp. RL_2_0]